MKNIIKEMAYPTQFSMEELLSIPSYSKKVAYAENHLKRISSGSSRTVFYIDDEKVLKVAKNKKGLAQNIAEADWGIQDMYPDLVAKVFETDDNGIFLEMELARKVTAKKFKDILGFTVEDVHWFLYEAKTGQNHIEDKELKERMWEDEWCNSLSDMCINYGYIMPGDFGKLSTYGLVTRDGEDHIVVIDFGLTKDVYDTHYKK